MAADLAELKEQRLAEKRVEEMVALKDLLTAD